MCLVQEVTNESLTGAEKGPRYDMTAADMSRSPGREVKMRERLRAHSVHLCDTSTR